MVSSNSTVPMRLCSDIWRTRNFDLRVWLVTEATKSGEKCATKFLNPGNGYSGAESQNFLYRCRGREDPKFIAVFSGSFVLARGCQKQNNVKVSSGPPWSHTWNHNSFAAKAKNFLLVILWEHEQPIAGRRPAWEPCVPQGQPGITAYRCQLAPLSWVPGKHKQENTVAALNTGCHCTSAFKIFLPPCLLMSLSAIKEACKLILSVRMSYNLCIFRCKGPNTQRMKNTVHSRNILATVEW